jgi:hypothetical protein
MLSLRSIFSALLITLMLMTSGAMASARGMARDAVGAMVLCTGSGTVTVLMDSDGVPIEATHICPDCVISFAPDAPEAFVLKAPDLVAGRIDVAMLGCPSAYIALTSASARSPPSV